VQSIEIRDSSLPLRMTPGRRAWFRHHAGDGLAALVQRPQAPYIPAVNLTDGAVIVGEITTIGRKTGLPRTVGLRLVYHGGCFYASSSRVGGKHWCQNMISNPAVEVTVNGERFACFAAQVTDDKLRRRILERRDSAPKMERVVFEMRPKG